MKQEAAPYRAASCHSGLPLHKNLAIGININDPEYLPVPGYNAPGASFFPISEPGMLLTGL